jgi:flagellar basal body rod protein FlgG
MLLHAAKARVDMERIEALYGSVAARLAALERRLDRLAANMANPPTHSR